ncbi:MAG: formyltransferase family protein [Rhodospirillales bacterium]
MRIAILTTQSPHHARFVAAMAERHKVAGVLVETDIPAAPFDTSHPIDDERDAFERNTWFSGSEPAFGDLAPSAEFPSLSVPSAAEKLADLKVEAAIVFGTRKLSGPILTVLGPRLVTLHCGAPQEYRGLDTALWAVYHGNFEGLVTTVQYVEPELNTGAILEQKPIHLHHGMELHQLRHASTEAFIDISDAAVATFSAGRMRIITPLQHHGRPYSFMPGILKGICAEKFRRHTETLA